jgi:hypothetical protein
LSVCEKWNPSLVGQNIKLLIVDEVKLRGDYELHVPSTGMFVYQTSLQKAHGTTSVVKSVIIATIFPPPSFALFTLSILDPNMCTTHVPSSVMSE